MDRLRVCVSPRCPTFVRRDCAQWEGEVEASVPTVVVAARGSDGRDRVDVRVTVDGQPFASGVDGIARPLDPGEHRFRFEAPSAPPVERLVVLHEGEKRRMVEAVLGPPPRPPQAPSSAATAASHARHPSDADAAPAGRGPWPWIFGGLGVVAGGVGAALGLSALGDYHALQRTCGANGSCAPSQVSALRARLWVADVAMVGGAVSLGVAGWLAIRPLPGGAAVQASGDLP
jgi:hypothetical protein